MSDAVPAREAGERMRHQTVVEDDSQATEDEFHWETESLSQSSRDGDRTPQKKRCRGRRALKQLLEDRTAPASVPLAPHDAAIKAAIRRGREVGERQRRRSVPTPRFGIQHSKMPTLHLERDTAIMQLVLDKRPFLIHRANGKRELLELIVRALKPNGVWAMTTDTVRRQIKWLGHVRLEESHPEHANLKIATELNAMLTEYYETSDTKLKEILQKINADAVVQPSEITFDDVLLLEVLQRRPFDEKKKRVQNVVWEELVTAVNERLGAKVFFSGSSCKDRVARLRAVARNSRHDPRIELSEPQRRMLADLEEVAAPSVSQRRSHGPNEAPEPEEINYLSLATEDEASGDDQAHERDMKRARLTNPRDAGKGDTAFGRIDHRVLTVILQETVRLRPFYGGTEQMALWEEIQSTVNRCAGSVIFSNHFECAQYVTVLMESGGASIPSDSMRLTDEHRDLLAQIAWPYHEKTTKHESSDVSKHPHDKHLHLEPARRTQSMQRHDKVKPEPERPRHTRDDSLAKTLEQRNQELEACIARGRQGFDAERAMLARRVADLEATVRNLQARLQTAEEVSSTWTQRLDEERRHHHAQLETLMDMLKTEREAQRQETRAVLEAFGAEREKKQTPLPSLRGRELDTTAHQQPHQDHRGLHQVNRRTPDPW